MSGICGICEPGIELPARLLEPMLAASQLADETAVRATSGMSVAMGVAQRWPFQDVRRTDGLVVAADADLCNFSTLAAEARTTAGREVTSVADLIAVLYAVSGLSFLDKIQGAFAIALWDPIRQQLALSVDRLGLRTLFWCAEGDRLLFSSRLAAIAATKERLELNRAALMQYLIHSVVPAPLSIYAGVERLQPGTLLVSNRGLNRKSRYWDLNYDESRDGSVRYWAREVRECVRRAVQIHLAGCNPLRTGTYLSGGTDSSSVVAFVNEQQPPVNTFSIYFENPRYSEIGYARTAAEHFQTRHHERCLHAPDVTEALTRIVDYYDEPFANSSAVGAYYCALLARQNGMDTLLAGDGGDELFAGNERYASDKRFAVYHRIPAFAGRLMKPALAMLPVAGRLSAPARYIRRAEIPNPCRFFSYSCFLSGMAEQALAPDFLKEVPPETWLDIPQMHFDSAPSATSELNRLLYLDVKMTLADNDVRKVAGTAEMAGVRVRFPLLDHRLAELSGQVPSRLKLKGFQKRYIFKQAMKGILPDQILYKKKHGFGVPVGTWMVDEPSLQSIVSVLDEPLTRQRGYFQPGFLSRLKDLNACHPAYYGEVLWGILVLELWHRRYFDCRARQTLSLGVVNAY